MQGGGGREEAKDGGVERDLHKTSRGRKKTGRSRRVAKNTRSEGKSTILNLFLKYIFIFPSNVWLKLKSTYCVKLLMIQL